MVNAHMVGSAEAEIETNLLFKSLILFRGVCCRRYWAWTCNKIHCNML